MARTYATPQQIAALAQLTMERQAAIAASSLSPDAKATAAYSTVATYARMAGIPVNDMQRMATALQPNATRKARAEGVRAATRTMGK